MNRIQSVDALRVVAITAVIVIHAAPFSNMSSDGSIFRHLSGCLNQVSRFAVPFFFTISGYFFGIKERRNDLDTVFLTISTAKRLFLIFLAWSLVYLLPYDLGSIYEYGISGPLKVAYWQLMSLASDPVRVIFHGTKAHLWFLAGLIWSVLFTGLSRHLGLRRTIYIVAASLYIAGLLGQSYSMSPFGIHFNFDTRNHIFFSTVYFVTGYWLSSYLPGLSWFRLGVMTFVFGTIIHVAEIYGLWRLYGTDPYIHSYTIGTYFMGTGAAVAALSNHRILDSDIIAAMGKYVLGIYAVHYLFVDILSPVSQLIRSPLWEIMKIGIILLLSMATSLLLSKNKYTEKIIR